MFFKNNDNTELPKKHNSLFAGSGICAGCHGSDTLNIAYLDSEGNDVNVLDDWQTSMMAMSAKDPFWRAKVSHEVLVNPDHAETLETKCTSCHAPLGHFAAFHDGQEQYSMAEMLDDSLALDGVSCVACHQIADLGESSPEFSGAVQYDTTGVLFGPYPDPLTGPMEIYADYIPEQGFHITRSEVCASCHTLQTETVDLDGDYTGDVFTEQATYHEWLNSIYALEGEQCQSCHLPRIADDIIIASGIKNLDPRSPFGLHHMVGGNAFMLELMKTYKDVLDIPASDAQFDNTIANTLELLKFETLDLELNGGEIIEDTAYYSLRLTNKAGHKFPSGYPARRAFIEFTVRDAFGDTLFVSGKLDDNYEVIGHDTTFEPHYDIIVREDEVQIYEMVMGDVNGNVTTVLERGKEPLKDNRLTPAGFKNSFGDYEFVQIAGNALTDSNFNFSDEGTEGSGSDLVHYHVPLGDYSINKLTAYAKIHYQSAPPKWMQEMFSVSSPEIDQFKEMYENSNRETVVVQEAMLGDEDFWAVGIDDPATFNFRVYPNPGVGQELFYESDAELSAIRLYSLNGKLLFKTAELPSFNRSLDLPKLPQGSYFLEFETRAGNRNSLKYIKL